MTIIENVLLCAIFTAELFRGHLTRVGVCEVEGTEEIRGCVDSYLGKSTFSLFFFL